MSLEDMTQDELYALAIKCDVEGRDDHCESCAAWALWCDRDMERAEKVKAADAERRWDRLRNEITTIIGNGRVTEDWNLTTFEIIEAVKKWDKAR